MNEPLPVPRRADGRIKRRMPTPLPPIQKKKKRRREREIPSLTFSVYIRQGGKTGKIRCRHTGKTVRFGDITNQPDRDTILTFIRKERDFWVETNTQR